MFKNVANVKGKNIVTVVVLAALSACGGGGGDSTPAYNPAQPIGTQNTNPVVPVTPVVLSTPAVTTVTAATYAVGSPEKEAYDYLNAERQRCGFGLLQQNAALDVAAKGHSEWMLLNDYQSHFQTSGTRGFTGLSVAARLVSAGYGPADSFKGGEDIDFSSFQRKSMQFSNLEMVKGLLNAPFHMRGMLGEFKDVGFASRASEDVGMNPSTTFYPVNLVVNFGYKLTAGKQDFAQDIVTYPCEGSVGVSRQLQGETPNPVPGRDLLTQPLGTSVYVGTKFGHKLLITSSKLEKASDATTVVLREPLTVANNPAPGLSAAYGENDTYIAADVALAANTAYRMSVTGTDNGAAFTRSFTFTTGD